MRNYDIENGEVAPLPKKFYDRCLALGVEEINIRFEGGSDEGYMDVSCYALQDPTLDRNLVRPLEEELTEWAYGTYQYDGAGEGWNYGHEIVYNLTKKRVELSEWQTKREDKDLGHRDMPPVVDDSV